MLQVDTYSFGVILFEVLSAFKISYMILNPEQPPRPQIEKYTNKVVEGYRPPIPSEWPESVASLIKGCWAANPDDRPSMTEVATALKQILRDEKMFQPSRKFKCSRNCCLFQ